MIDGYIFLHLILLFLRCVVEFGGIWFWRKDSISPVELLLGLSIKVGRGICVLGGGDIDFMMLMLSFDFIWLVSRLCLILVISFWVMLVRLRLYICYC